MEDVYLFLRLIKKLIAVNWRVMSLTYTEKPALKKIMPANNMNISHGKDNPQRHPETIRKIWIAPYEDNDGNYHQGSDVHTVLQPGFWESSQIKE